MKDKIKKSLLVSLTASILAFPFPIFSLEKEKDELMAKITYSDDFYTIGKFLQNLGLTLQIYTAQDPTLNIWTTTEIPLDSKINLGVHEETRMVYIKNLNEILPKGYIPYFDQDKPSTLAIDISSLESDFLPIWAVPDLSYSQVQNTDLQFRQNDGTLYSLPLKENSYTPFYACKKGDTLSYTILLDFKVYQQDLEALTKNKVYSGSSKDGYIYTQDLDLSFVTIDVLENGKGIHRIDQDWHEGIPFICPPRKNVEYPQYHVSGFYNKQNNDFLFTMNQEEKEQLFMSSTWEQIPFSQTVPEISDFPVYRLYNPNTQEHLLTMDKNEYDTLTSYGWNPEGIGLYSTDPSDKENNNSLYRLYNPKANQDSPSHLYTYDRIERDILGNQGWIEEGITMFSYDPRSD